MDKNASVSGIEFVAFDFETTGLSSYRDQIVEFGAVRFKAGKILAEFKQFIDPGIPMPPECSRVTGITDSMLAGQPKLEEILPSFLAFISDAVLLAHNADFDTGFLRAAIQRLGGATPDNLIIDTLGLAKRAFPGQKSYSLSNLAEALRLPPNQAHRAYDDSVTCMHLFEKCAEALSFMGEIPLADVIA